MSKRFHDFGFRYSYHYDQSAAILTGEASGEDGSATLVRRGGKLDANTAIRPSAP